ncbi:MAG: hypothetical protein AB7F86_19090, partial [Bdellovibrionales bacterium]
KALSAQLDFKTFSDSNPISGINDDDDGAPILNGHTARSLEDIEFVKECDETRAEAERQAAMAKAAADTSQRTVPVRFNYSFGYISDATAGAAHNRAILNRNGTGKIRLSGLSVDVDYSNAKNQFLHGEACSYSTVLADSAVGVISQPIDIPVADLRDARMQTGAGPVLRIDQSTFKAPRNSQVTLRYRDLINFARLFETQDQILDQYSEEFSDEAFGVVLQPYDGMAQVIENVITNTSWSETITGTYTPLVVDLGEPHILTSSMHWGTFFNVAGLTRTDKSDAEKYLVRHRTAWVGGAIVNKGTLDQPIYKREAEDGILVLDVPLPLPGQPLRLDARNLFGSVTNIAGKTFSNGFKALSALSNKMCASPEIRDKYLGPWDVDLYYNRIRVWVDKNRNGLAEVGEISSLAENRIAAINVCYHLDKEEFDRHGNNTSMRSAYLRMGPGEEIGSATLDLIYRRLRTGYSDVAKTQPADFRVVIDILFKGDVNSILEDVKLDNVQLNGKTLPLPEVDTTAGASGPAPAGYVNFGFL